MSTTWKEVGEWVKKNAGAGAALVGSLLTGNVQGVVAAGAALVSSATGTNNPAEALAALQSDPATVVNLRELAVQEQDSIRRHIETMEANRLKDEAEAHGQQQETIRHGDKAEDEYVRHTRPKMARQSWYGAAAYVGVMEIAKATGHGTGANLEIAALVMAPALAYIGFRSMFDKTGGLFKRN